MGLSRSVSDAGLEDDGSPSYGGTIANNVQLRRQVSTEALAGLKSPVDGASAVHCLPIHPSSEKPGGVWTCYLHRHPLHDKKMLRHHRYALQLEFDLQPLRLILSRLMAHAAYNKKGIFNIPVDPVSLGIPDYWVVIDRPMDFGTIKGRLHALAFQSREEVVHDIRLVMENAMKYNPPQHHIHVAAKNLMFFFEDQLLSFCPEMSLHVLKPDTIQCETKGRQDSCLSAETNRQHVDMRSLSCHNGGTPNFVPEASFAAIMSNHATKLNMASENFGKPIRTSHSRKKRGSNKNIEHQCNECEGRSCLLCGQGCLHLEPTLLVCNGFNCGGSRIRKGASYYVAPDGSRQYCQRCFIGLPAVSPYEDASWRYKSVLLKRKNDEEMVERWLTCTKCGNGLHAVCALHDELVDSYHDFACPRCTPMEVVRDKLNVQDLYTFASGSSLPLRMSEITDTPLVHQQVYTAERLLQTMESTFIENKVRESMKSEEYPHAEKTVFVRVISDFVNSFEVPSVVRKHFRMPGSASAPPDSVRYRSKAIALFQKIDGMDVCIYCMYVQEYDGDSQTCQAHQTKRVYIAYIDSVEHFQPRSFRTKAYQELLVGYLAAAKKRGFATAHIWACPPSRGNSFVFWNHPASQRTPSQERLIAWYHKAVSRAVACGVVCDVRSLYECEFQGRLEALTDKDIALSNKMECPPLFDGDFWLEEAVRLHQVSFARMQKAKLEPNVSNSLEKGRVCPAFEVAKLLREKIFTSDASSFFRKPVNAVAMKLTNYHQVVSHPMDLGTIHSKLVLGEYSVLQEMVGDLELIVSNATTFNPKGSSAYECALRLSKLFEAELNHLVSLLLGKESWLDVAMLSLSLDHCLPSKEQDNSERAASAEMERECAENSPGHVDQGTDLLSGGVQAVAKRMVGDDSWLIEKNATPVSSLAPMKHGRKRRMEANDLPTCKRRRQSWLAVEVGASVRRNRCAFFYCSLLPSLCGSSSTEQEQAFQGYTEEFKPELNRNCELSTVADLRHAFLEFCQFRNLEFNTLRRAKHSSKILLYHLHNPNAKGAIPQCTTCCVALEDVRWHRISRVNERRASDRKPSSAGRRPKQIKEHVAEELCQSCYLQAHDQNEFIPIPVSTRTARGR